MTECASECVLLLLVITHPLLLPVKCLQHVFLSVSSDYAGTGCRVSFCNFTPSVYMEGNVPISVGHIYEKRLVSFNFMLIEC